MFDHDKCDGKALILKKAKEELEEHRKPYIEGLIVRSRTQWYEDGEKSSKYFLSLEKRNAAKSRYKIYTTKAKPSPVQKQFYRSLLTHFRKNILLKSTLSPT